MSFFSSVLPRGLRQNGVFFAFITAFFWATLPVGLKLTVERVDPFTITWFRALVASIAFTVFAGSRGELAAFAQLDRRAWGTLVLAAAMLTGNYVLYLSGLQYTSAANTQVFMQLAPLLLALGGMWLFKERLSRAQRSCSGILLLGLALFFADQLRFADGGLGNYARGSALVIASAVAWAVYALCQKALGRRLSSAAILAFICLFATLMLSPAIQIDALRKLDPIRWGTLLFCAFNMVVAYAALSAALLHTEAARVSAVLAVNPLLTLAVVRTAHRLLPDLFAAFPLSLLGWVGALTAVVGSIGINLRSHRFSLGWSRWMSRNVGGADIISADITSAHIASAHITSADRMGAERRPPGPAGSALEPRAGKPQA